MQLDWLKNSTDTAPDGVVSQNRNHVLHLATCQTGVESAFKESIIETAHKAAQLLEDNIEDDSLYLMFSWQPELATLSAVVTDDKKVNDAQHIVRCFFPEVTPDCFSEADTLSEYISYWIRDYLTTSSEYMRFSLVSIFTDSTREHTSML